MTYNSDSKEYILSVCNKFPSDSAFAEYVGVDPTTVSNWKTGKKKPSAITVRVIQLLEFIQSSNLEIPPSYE
jgi:DNA-binding transcriptional regulator YdaS (Cro superfamily)